MLQPWWACPWATRSGEALTTTELRVPTQGTCLHVITLTVNLTALICVIALGCQTVDLI